MKSKMTMSEVKLDKIIKTKYGKVQGYGESDLEIYKGIPYAEPPIGDLRFRPPVAKKAWDDVLDATKFGPCSYQGYMAIEEMMVKPEPESEDCLNLNIWTPATDNGRRPVLFWIHGGAFIRGSGMEPMYDGSNLARRGDVVLVSINYRLGAFGYLYIPGITANVAQLDMILALEWVRDNIDLFGGDPGNVTIFGESSGSLSCIALTAMPAAKGLFHRIIAQSGASFDPSTTEEAAKGLMKLLDLEEGDIDGLRKIPAEKILKAQNEYQAKNPGALTSFRPVIENDTLPINPIKAFQNGDCKNIDLMTGTNLDEWKLFSAMDTNFDNMVKAAGENVLPGYLGTSGIDNIKSKEIIDIYKKEREGKLSNDPKELLNVLITEFAFRIPTIRLLEAQSKHQSKSFTYMLTWPSPMLEGIFGACHALELPFVFNTVNYPGMEEFTGEGPEVEALSEKMMNAWIVFARTGNPNHKGIPEWAPYDVNTRTTMLFGKEIKTVDAPLDKERAAWDGLFEI
jgi:para-nitrobenzyl esterase